MHFLRPEWAVAVIVFALVPVMVRFARSGAGAWRKVCDASLLNALLVKSKARSLFPQLFLLSVCWVGAGLWRCARFAVRRWKRCRSRPLKKARTLCTCWIFRR